MPNTFKTSKDRGKLPAQTKLTDFGAQNSETKVSKEANMEATEQSGGELT